jgi:hypothetical protein
MTKKIKDLPQDIYNLFDPDVAVEVDEDILEAMCNNIKHSVREALNSSYGSTKGKLRMSQVGKPDRQVWLEYHEPEIKEAMEPNTYVKFLYGHLIEELVVMLAKTSGHEVRGEQDVMELNGIVGHRDCVIDNVLVDVKSASTFAYNNKFVTGDVVNDHSFGYPTQLAAYLESSSDCDPDVAGWVAFDKTHGKICVTLAPKNRLPNAGLRMDTIKEVVKGPMPEPCYDPVPDGKSGNMKLPVGCSYCSFKHKCYPELRTFLYSGGPRFLTRVKVLPKVMEV